MTNQHQTGSFQWFDELPTATNGVHVLPVPVRESTPNLYALQKFAPPTASVALRKPKPEGRVSIWSLVLAAIAGASVFVLGVALVEFL